MQDVLIRAGCFVAIIIAGFILRRTGFFKEGAFEMLSKIVLRITLPAAIIKSYSGATLDSSMLSLIALGFGGGLVYVGAALLVNLKSSKERRAFDVLNLPGFNIGVFAMPFISSFLGPAGVVAASVFDTGNAFICLGGTYGVAASIKDGGGFSLKRIGKALVTSVPFLVYIIMMILAYAKITLPTPVLSLAELVSGANAFLAMLMIGVGFKLEAKREQIGHLLKIVVLRYGIAAALSACFYFLLPFSLEVRQTLAILAFAPIGAAVPGFTADLKEDTGLSSAINSVCIIISIVIMVALLSVMLY